MTGPSSLVLKTPSRHDCLSFADMQIMKTVLAMTGKLGISGAFAIIYVFSAELFPTVVRTIGVGAGSMSARVGGLMAPFIAELVGDKVPGLPLQYQDDMPSRRAEQCRFCNINRPIH